MARYLSFAYGVLSCLLFLVVFLYAIAFVGDLPVPKTIDRGAPQASMAAALGVNLALLGLFAVQHSVMAQTGPVVLSGDLYHFRLSREDQRVPTVNFDREQTLESMERIEAFVDEVGAEIWIEHEAARFDTLRKAPSHYP